MTELDKIRAEAEAATEGPWLFDQSEFSEEHIAPILIWSEFDGEPCDIAHVHHGDEEFIAHTRTTVPRLCAVIDMMKKYIERGYEEHVEQKANKILKRET